MTWEAKTKVEGKRMTRGSVMELDDEVHVEEVLKPFPCFHFKNSLAFDLECLQQILAMEVLFIVDIMAVMSTEVLL